MENMFLKIFIGFIIVGVTGFLGIMIIESISSPYGKDTSEMTSGYNIQDFKNSIKTVNDSAEGVRVKAEEFGKDKNVFTFIADVVSIVGLGIWSAIIGLLTVILTPLGLINGILKNVFNIPIEIVSVINGIVILVILLAIWRLAKIGD